MMPTEQDIQQQLWESRRKLKKEMQAAISCISQASKKKLVARWKEEYSEMMFDQLLRCAKNREVRIGIAGWDLDNFEQKRSK